jgi:3-oxoacyl-[acyl-carrier-protein] synthase III
MSSIIDYRDRATCVLFGDAAGAVLVEPNEIGYGIMDALIHSDGSGMIHLHQKAGWQPHAADCRHRRQTIALRSPGGCGCL